MKRCIKDFTGFTISGIDGEIGEVEEFYFDDETWTIRYVIVETGSWLFGRKVLLSTRAITNTNWDQKLFIVHLTMEQIENSPFTDTDMPVSRQHEMELFSYYPWESDYWSGGMGFTGIGMSYPVSLRPDTKRDTSDDDLHLRSTKRVTGYNIKATDGEIGDVEDFLIDESTWKIGFMLVDTGNWFPGKKVLISPALIKEVSWESSTVTVKATEEQVKNSPEYQPGPQLSASYESNLQNYYGRFMSHNQ